MSLNLFLVAQALATLASDPDGGIVTLVVHQIDGYDDWYAAICSFGSRVPLLCKNGNESLCASGCSPTAAMRALDDKLPGLV